MSGIGERLREERERLRLSQAAFGEIGGVKANAQGKYESGERFPSADYLAAVALHGADVLYVVTGERKPLPSASLTAEEIAVLAHLRVLPETDRAATARMVAAMAEMVGRK
ncbi:MAG: helix-turn-helix domain-containing protein [Gammaproteobacteria bacterium]|nr:helix-turn-helix domain-containing protein [Gammaproteobacteria bacterium]MBU1491204.1 helix-turn-helix domain-containing protein [Gammaproteobacteria bacterium]MBU2067870.1 helix-turn-helix domain-containing protein [Gammaproteobacteria bacterium]MBU2139350.1 helix-turn-helix domain-containing protein [Gammaproteobacteria bacterium]MBU2217222.1 helix-turn-helix domain-containing protein [Gammaproteobacteria bacterium]